MRSCWFFIAGILNKHMWENTKAWHCNTSFFIKKKTDYDAFSVLSQGGITARVMPGVLHCFYQVETAATKHIRLLCVIFQEANGPDLFNNGTF